MRMSKMFSQTLRDAPSDARTITHQLLERAGFIRQSSRWDFHIYADGLSFVNKD